MLNVNQIFIVMVVVLGIVGAGVLIRKKYDIRVTLFGIGIFFMLIATLQGLPILPEASSSGLLFFDIFRQIANTFISQLSGAGLIIMVLFGFTAYMNEIGANQTCVKVISSPLLKVKNKRLIVPAFFFIASSLCMIIPSAASLGVLLMATAYPTLVSAGVSPLTAASMIAMAAGVAPTPLGSDNVIIHGYLNMSLHEYVFRYHALVSLPVILLLCVVQYFWQGYCDKLDNQLVTQKQVNVVNVVKPKAAPRFYAILPLLPLLFMFVFAILEMTGHTGVSLQLVELTFVALLIAIFVDLIRTKNGQAAMATVKTFFTGMANGFVTVVVQVVAAMTFIHGLRVLGVIEALSSFTNEVLGGGLLAIVIFCLLIVAVGLLSGTGLSLFMGLIPLIPLFADDAGVSAVAMMISMQFTAHFTKTISPLSPVMIITSDMMGVNALALAKRTIVPSLIGATLSILLAYVLFHRAGF